MSFRFVFDKLPPINESGELLAFDVTPGNVHDNQMLDQLDGSFLFGKLFGDKGYLSEPERKDLRDKGIDLVPSSRRS